MSAARSERTRRRPTAERAVVSAHLVGDQWSWSIHGLGFAIYPDDDAAGWPTEFAARYAAGEVWREIRNRLGIDDAEQPGKETT